jgi:uncharacterized protein (TIGR02996 family)
VTHDDAFLADVLATPLDDAPRLIYADWLEDAGTPDRAEFIRVQCEWAAMSGCLFTTEDDGNGDPGGWPCRCPWHVLHRRQRELLAHRSAADWTPPALRPFSVAFRRGFVESVTLTADNFLEHASALFAGAPLLEVVLVDRSPIPRPDLNAWLWLAGESWHWPPHRLREPAAHQVPLPLYQRLRGPHGWTNYFPTRKGARTALSRACVVWGRERAGLPALPVEPDPVALS